MDNNCFICKRLRLWKENRNPYFIHEFKNSILVLGDHQFFKGYSLLLLKEHIRELHELPETVQDELNKELMLAGRSVFQAYKPWKMNYSCYGNAVEHVHWHIFPRYQSDPDHKMHPWLHCAEFKKHQVSEADVKAAISLIRQQLDRLRWDPD